MKNKKDHIYKELPKKCDPKDFFGQVKRTVNGKPVSKKDIKLIVDTIKSNLLIQNEDHVFDIGCGNGALAALFFENIKSYLGVDFSEYLVQVAKDNFEKPNFEFILDDAISYMENMNTNNQITKVLCYGVFSYFTKSEAYRLLKLANEKFPKAERFYIGNLPDKSRAENFYYDGINYESLLEDNQSSIGKWWSQQELKEVCNKAMWNVSFYKMPDTFYSSHYRFDAILTRK